MFALSFRADRQVAAAQGRHRGLPLHIPDLGPPVLAGGGNLAQLGIPLLTGLLIVPSRHKEDSAH
ncbi:MAG: hypothetical protein D3904_16175 [Candidatus Electrothrix sp. EH2]|nr:hypothetical protein [Candidatus Electrothrix sp. EH2]